MAALLAARASPILTLGRLIGRCCRSSLSLALGGARGHLVDDVLEAALRVVAVHLALEGEGHEQRLQRLVGEVLAGRCVISAACWHSFKYVWSGVKDLS